MCPCVWLTIGQVSSRPATVAYCIVFNFPDLYLYTTSFLLLAWASFERHILIFRAQLFNTTLRRLLGHYIPLSFCCVYPLLYYIVFFLSLPLRELLRCERWQLCHSLLPMGKLHHGTVRTGSARLRADASDCALQPSARHPCSPTEPSDGSRTSLEKESKDGNPPVQYIILILR